MTKKSRTEYVILGLLTIRPMSGYRIKKAIDQQMQHFWSESFGQLYPALDRLEEEGKIKVVDSKMDVKRKRSRYKITGKGQKVLQEWLDIPPEDEHQRSELLLKLFFGRENNRAQNIAHLSAAIERAQGQKRDLEAQRFQIEQEGVGDPNTQYQLMTLDYGIDMAKTELKWAQKIIDTISGTQQMLWTDYEA